MKPLTRPQRQTIEELRTGPSERPSYSGMGGWAIKMRNLEMMGLIEISAPDADGRVWASITDAGLAYEPPAKRPVGRPPIRSVRAGDLPGGVEAVNRMLARNKTGAR